jgi:hypothetical protein
MREYHKMLNMKLSTVLRKFVFSRSVFLVDLMDCVCGNQLVKSLIDYLSHERSKVGWLLRRPNQRPLVYLQEARSLFIYNIQQST